MKENWEPQGCVFSVFSLYEKLFSNFLLPAQVENSISELGKFQFTFTGGVLVMRAVPLLGNREIFLISSFKNIASRRIRTFGSVPII